MAFVDRLGALQIGRITPLVVLIITTLTVF
jgi:hypothetical protein